MFTVQIYSGLCNVIKSFVTALSIADTNLLPRFDTHFDADFREILDDSLICHGPHEFRHSFVSARWLILKNEEDEQEDLINDAKVLGDKPDIQNKQLKCLFSTKTIDWFYSRALISDRVYNRIMGGIDKIRWTDIVYKEVERVSKLFTYPLLVIQVRTWTHKFDPKNIFFINDGVTRAYNFETYKNAIDTYLPSCKSIFLTVDNDSVLPQYMNYLKEYNVITYTQPLNITQLQFSTATMLLGAKADMLVCSRLSTFAECMWWFGKCKAKVSALF